MKRFIDQTRPNVQRWAMKFDMLIMTLVLLCAGMFILCDGLSAHWGKTGSGRSLLTALLLSPICYSAFAFINTRLDLSVTGALVNTLVVVGGALVGVLFFKEQLSSAQYLGIALAVLSVTLLNLS